MTNILYSTDNARWQAVQERDPCADGLFVYAVRTTKIYCRPVCKARPARRANVTYYMNGSEAEHAGYRACKRCKPQAMGGMPDTAAVARIRALIEQRDLDYMMWPKTEGTAKQTTEMLAQKANVSKWHFHRVFKRLTGVRPAEYDNVQALYAQLWPMDVVMSDQTNSYIIPDIVDESAACPLPNHISRRRTVLNDGSGSELDLNFDWSSNLIWQHTYSM